MSKGIGKKIKSRILGKQETLDLHDPAITQELFSLELGKDYKKYWDNLAATKQLAYFAVAGLPFGELPDDKNIEEHGRQTAEIITKKLEITPKDDVLEVGVGVGRIAGHIAKTCKSFTGIDISKQMIKFANKRLGAVPNIKLLHHPQSDLSLFPDKSFDKVYFQIVLIHLDREDVFHYLRESFRVLRPGGKAWFQFYNLLHPEGFKEFKHAVDMSVKLGGKLRGRVQCLTADEVRKYVGEAGFKILGDQSHLNTENQKYEFEPPDTHWFYYLIAVCEKSKEGPARG
jgi:ubiquinone/menaquinone biosynthesis C-methylase UbiE